MSTKILRLSTFMAYCDPSPTSPQWFKDFFALQVQRSAGCNLSDEDLCTIAGALEDIGRTPGISRGDLPKDNHVVDDLWRAYTANADDPGNFEDHSGHWSVAPETKGAIRCPHCGSWCVSNSHPEWHAQSLDESDNQTTLQEWQCEPSESTKGCGRSFWL